MILVAQSEYFHAQLERENANNTNSPTIGALLALTTEEIVIAPRELDDVRNPIDVRVHFPRLGFVVRPVQREKL